MSRRRRARASAAEAEAEAGVEDAARLRLDRWLWHVRAFRSRTLSAERIEAGGVRLNGQPCRKPGRMVAPGDVVTFSVSRTGRVFVYEVLAPGTRRGPASEAATLYRDLSPEAGAGSGDDPTETAP